MPTIPINQLQPGVFISLEGVGWLAHPFLRNRFCITSPDQIHILRELGIAEIEWDPSKSTAAPLPPPNLSNPASADEPEEEIDFSANTLDVMLDNKKERAKQVIQQRETLARCERLFERETGSIGQVLRDLHSLPSESFHKAKGVVDSMVNGLVKAVSVAVHLVNMKAIEPGPAHHAMNVMVLSLLIGKSAGATEEELKSLGMGAIFHDAGKAEIPVRVLRSPNRTVAEKQLYQSHVGLGIKYIEKMKDLPIPSKNIIACHHERWDGQGFPNRLVGAKIPKLARIVAIANRYDNLCNPPDPALAMTPAEAVSSMFKHEVGSFDPDLLQPFVKALGVYPPGSFVSLSDGSIGLVVETNSNALLSPLVMIYDESIPRSEALLLDLRDADVKINGIVTPNTLPTEVVQYMAPRGRVDYYIEGAH